MSTFVSKYKCSATEFTQRMADQVAAQKEVQAAFEETMVRPGALDRRGMIYKASLPHDYLYA